MKSFATSISIRARPETIWRLLTTAEGYPGWTSTVARIDGRIAEGETITVHAPGGGQAFPVKVTELSPYSQMVWQGGMPLGLFTGTRRFTLTPAADGSVEFDMREAFTGLLSPLIGRAIPDLQPNFDAFAADLKASAERAG